MNFLANKMTVMNLLGTGLSVHTLIERVGITYDQLCQLAQEYPELHKELKRWYKRYDFTVKQKEQDNPSETKKKPVKRAKKQQEHVVGE
jgi:hypothetical protein